MPSDTEMKKWQSGKLVADLQMIANLCSAAVIIVFIAIF